MKIFCILILLIVPRISQGETIQFYGDILLSRGIQDLIEHEGVDSLWKGTETLFSKDAIRIANLEGAVGKASSCTSGHKICFHIDAKALPAVDKFDIISLANNHSLDLGIAGRNGTIRELKKRHLIPLGGKNYSTIIETENGLIGVVALTDVLNSPNDKKYSTLADSSSAIREIQRLKKLTGLVVVFIHWGRELDNLPTARMRQLAKSYLKAGADIIVGHHPHVIGKTECIDGHPVVYSLGNFLFDQKYEDTKKGAVLQCSHSKDGTLRCSLIGVQAPMNSFVPYIQDNTIIQKDNDILASCVTARPTIWSGVFSEDNNIRRYTLTQNEKGVALYSIQRLDSNKDSVIWQSPAMPIRKLQTVSLNGDGLSEVMLLQDIYSTLDNEVAKRVYIYSLDNGLRALWRGSGLSRPLLDAVFVKKPASEHEKPLLIALHSTDSFLVRNKEKDGCIVMSYRWNGFGFTGIKQMRFQVKANRLSLAKDKIRLINPDGLIIGEVNINELTGQEQAGHSHTHASSRDFSEVKLNAVQ